MKKFLFAICLLFGLGTQAQTSTYTKGDILFSGAYGFATPYKLISAFDFTTTTGIVGLKSNVISPIYGKFEYMIGNRVGLGINGAMLLSTHTFGFNYSIDTMQYSTNVKYSRRAMSALIRVNYHFLNSERSDLYAGIGFGFRQNFTKFTVNNNDETVISKLASRVPTTILPIGMDFTLGYRFYATPQLGIFTEIGLAKSIGQIGITYCIKSGSLQQQ